MTSRIPAVDIARTLALIAMAIFHFTYDLELFGFIAAGTMLTPQWVWTARLIAGSFIFLSGVSLVLAASGGPLPPRKVLKRLAMIGAAAALVSAGTYVAMGAAFVRFGILHLLFVASALGLLMLRLPSWVTGLGGLAILALPLAPFWPLLHDAHWLWLGATVIPPPMMVDYVPIIPWVGVFMMGMGASGLMARAGLWAQIARRPGQDARWAQIASWPGRHSLAIYLIHQPVLFACVYAAKLLMT